jgi:tRNA A37 threonylcarbamoyladenosine biosynthesis protein TsaE
MRPITEQWMGLSSPQPADDEFSWTLKARSVDETWKLAEQIANACREGDVILLRGDVGAGKTTFARGFLRTFVGDPDLTVASPTFLLHHQV